MREKLLKLVKDDKELLQLFLIIKLNNFTTLEQKEGKTKTKINGAFNYLSYEDLLFYDFLIEKWKSATKENIEKIVTEEIENRLELIKAEDGDTPTKEEIEKAKEGLAETKLTEHGLYLESLKELEENIDLEFIGKALFIFYDLVVYSDLLFFLKLADLIKTLEDHNKEPIAEAIKDYLKDLININDTETSLNKKNVKDALNNSKDASYYEELKKTANTFKIIAIAHTRNHILRHPKERIAEKMNYYLLEPNKEDIETLKRVLTDTLEEDYNGLGVEELKDRLKHFIYACLSYAEECDRTGLYISAFLEELEEKYNINNLAIDPNITNEGDIAEEKEIKHMERAKLLDIKYLDTKKHLATLEAKDITKESNKNIAVLEVLKGLTSNNMLESILELDASKKSNKKLIEALGLTEKAEPTEFIRKEEIESAPPNIWIKTYTLPLNDNMRATSQRFINLKNPITNKLSRLKELEEIEKPSKDEEIEKNELKVEIEKYIKEKEQLEEEIAKTEESIKELGDQLLDEEIEDKKSIEILLKQKHKQKEEQKAELEEKYLNKRNYIQLRQDYTTGEQVLVSNEGTIELTIKNSTLKKYNAEVERLSYYIENLFYNTPKDKRNDYYIIDLDDYAEATGRVLSTKLRKNIGDALDCMQEETFINIEEYNEHGLYIKKDQKIKRIGSTTKIDAMDTRGPIKNHSRKARFYIALDKLYIDILWNYEARFWASIPNTIMKIQNPLTRGLGFYLYEDLKRNLNGTGYYTRHFTKIGIIIKALNKKKLLATNTSNRYSRRVIEPLKEAFNELVDLGLITYDEENDDNAFKYYEDHLIGHKDIQKTFEAKPITITFEVYDNKLYDKILTTRQNNRKKNNRKKQNKK